MTSLIRSTGFRCPFCCTRAGEPHLAECKSSEAWEVAVGTLPEAEDADPVQELIDDQDPSPKNVRIADTPR